MDINLTLFDFFTDVGIRTTRWTWCRKRCYTQTKLMNWIQEKLPPELPITNFTSDWNDGRAIGALVDACAPGKEIQTFNPLKNFLCLF